MKRPSPAAVIACVALFFSLGGAGLAATAASGPTAYYVNARALLPADSASDTVVSASCHPNDHVLISGFQSAHGIVTSSYPLGRTWIVRAHRDPAYQAAQQNMSGATVAPGPQPPMVALTVECQSG